MQETNFFSVMPRKKHNPEMTVFAFFETLIAATKQ